MNPNLITFVQRTFKDDYEQTREGIRLILPYVDRVLIGLPDTEPEVEFPPSDKIQIIRKPFHDDYAESWNQILSELCEGWVLSFDPDEYPNETFLKNLRRIVADSANGLRYNWVKLNAHDVVDGVETKSTYYRAVFWKWYPSAHYEPIGVGFGHESLQGVPWLPYKLSDECYYRHVKTTLQIMETSWKDFHIHGGGNCLGPKNPLWPVYRQLIEHIDPKLLEWRNMRLYIQAGNIDERLKHLLNENRNRNVIPDADQEFRNAWRYYFELLHPTENIDHLTQRPDEPPAEMADYPYIEQAYLEVLGRHADEQGKATYAKLIREGKLPREQLPVVLKQSQEYLEMNE